MPMKYLVVMLALVLAACSTSQVASNKQRLTGRQIAENAGVVPAQKADCSIISSGTAGNRNTDACEHHVNK